MTSQIRSYAQILFIIFHLHIGQNVLSFFWPKSDSALFSYKRFLELSDARVHTEENVEYVRGRLRYVDVSGIEITKDFNSYGELGSWRKFVRQSARGALMVEDKR